MTPEKRPSVEEGWMLRYDGMKAQRDAALADVERLREEKIEDASRAVVEIKRLRDENARLHVAFTEQRELLDRFWDNEDAC